jgi:hypothetical protein
VRARHRLSLFYLNDTLLLVNVFYCGECVPRGDNSYQFVCQCISNPDMDSFDWIMPSTLFRMCVWNRLHFEYLACSYRFSSVKELIVRSFTLFWGVGASIYLSYMYSHQVWMFNIFVYFRVCLLNFIVKFSWANSISDRCEFECFVLYELIVYGFFSSDTGCL